MKVFFYISVLCIKFYYRSKNKNKLKGLTTVVIVLLLACLWFKKGSSCLTSDMREHNHGEATAIPKEREGEKGKYMQLKIEASLLLKTRRRKKMEMFCLNSPFLLHFFYAFSHVAARNQRLTVLQAACILCNGASKSPIISLSLLLLPHYYYW